MTLPIGGADMPVVISMYNALTGVAVALDGFALVDTSAGAAAYAMIIAGTLVGAAGTFLTVVMARAMNRSLANVLFAAYGSKVEETGDDRGVDEADRGRRRRRDVGLRLQGRSSPPATGWRSPRASRRSRS